MNITVKLAFHEEGAVRLLNWLARENARILREAVGGAGLKVYGGVDAPYIWVRGPEGVPSWTMFDFLLREANIVATPGSGFGAAGEGYFRISAFNHFAVTEWASGVKAMCWSCHRAACAGPERSSSTMKSCTM